MDGLKKILFIYNDGFMNKLLTISPLDFDENFFSSDIWPVRPNSTSRLNIANYQAVKLATSLTGWNVDHRFFRDFDEEVASFVSRFDVVVLHQVASDASKNFVNDFVNYWRPKEKRPRIIFGTEITWGGELKKGVFSREVLDFIYRENTLLRHTPKTDRFFYSEWSWDMGRVREFELGVDTEFLSFGKKSVERKYISFVRAPEGRAVKNNALIDVLVEKVNKCPGLSGFEVRVINPPYSSVRYWELMSESAFLVFTSNSETFSYALNDARALGVVAYHPSHMYMCCFEWGCVENYPDSPHKYSSPDDLINKMALVAQDDEMLSRESARSRNFVENNFSLRRVALNWVDVIEGRDLPNKALILDGTQFSVADAFKRAEELGASFVIFYLNKVDYDFSDSFAVFDEESGICIVRYYLDCVQGGVFRLLRKLWDTKRIGPLDLGDGELAKDTALYLQVVMRIYKIGVFYVSNAVLKESAFDIVRLDERFLPL